MPTKQVVIDACSALNLLATERNIDILHSLDWKLLVLPEVRQEVRYHQGPPDDEGQPTRLAVDWNPLEQAGRVVEQHSAPLDDAFTEAFVDAAAHLTDIDALAVALAGTLKVPLLSDDGKVRKTFRRLYPALDLHSTLGSIRQAAGQLGFGADILRPMLRGLYAKARFAPPKGDPDRGWYASHLAD